MSNENINTNEISEDFNKALEEKILKANEDKTLVKWNKLLPELMSSEILLAGMFPNGNEGASANLLILQYDGRNIVPFFTNPDRMSVLPQEQTSRLNMIKMNTGDFFRSIKGMGAVLNPSTEYAKVFSGFDVKVLATEYEEAKENNSEEE